MHACTSFHTSITHTTIGIKYIRCSKFTILIIFLIWTSTRIHNTAKRLCVKSILTLYSSEKLLYETILVRSGFGVFVVWWVGICIAPFGQATSRMLQKNFHCQRNIAILRTNKFERGVYY